MSALLSTLENELKNTELLGLKYSPEWGKFFDSDEEITTPRGTLEFKQIRAVYEAYKAYLTHLNK